MSQAFEYAALVTAMAGIVWSLEKLKPWLTGLLL
jgi:hypothetical protein|tara:strand:- start:297 stop:398 length:102 start_codon:yes stop_codon:yes gene_type:complete